MVCSVPGVTSSYKAAAMKTLCYSMTSAKFIHRSVTKSRKTHLLITIDVLKHILRIRMSVFWCSFAAIGSGEYGHSSLLPLFCHSILSCHPC